jgi:hypothetical protein
MWSSTSAPIGGIVLALLFWALDIVILYPREKALCEKTVKQALILEKSAIH